MALSDIPALPQGVPASLQSDGASTTTLYSAPANGGQILTVGASGEYQTIAAAINASQDGDIIEVQAGTYVNDTADITHNITIEGVGGMVDLVETQPLPNEKGIFITDANVTMANMTFSGAEIPDDEGANGAGIRYQGGNLTLINDGFTNNQNGILGSPVDGLPSNTITIENSSFANNGDGDPNSVGYGYTHDIYVGAVTSFVMTNSVVLGVAGVGNDVKSRAQSTTLENNVISDLNSAASYSIDLPNGGDDTVTGNFIEQGPNSPNEYIMDYATESLPYASSSLTIQGNTIVNQDASGGSTLLLNDSAVVAAITGNTIEGLTTGQIANGPVQATKNVDGSGNALADITNTTQLSGADNIVYTDAAPHTITLTTAFNGDGVEGGAGLLTIDSYASHITVIGGSGGLIYLEEAGTGGSIITTAPGETNRVTLFGQDTLYSQGNDTITLGAGNVAATIDGNATVAGGTGTDSYLVNGTANITGGGGSDFFNVGASGSLTFTGADSAIQGTSIGGTLVIDTTVASSLEQATVTGGSVSVQSYSNALNWRTAGGSEAAVMLLGAGNDNVLSFAADTIYAGSGTDLIQLNAAGATVYAGTGQLSVYGRSLSGAAYVYGNGGDYLISGDTGNIVYYGGVLASTVEAQLSNISIIGGTGHVTINGSTRDTINGGIGGITLNEGAADSITTAAGSANSITLDGECVVNSYGNDTIALGSDNQTVTAYGNAKITGSGNNSITLLGSGTFTATAGTQSINVGKGANATVVSAGWTGLSETGGTVAYTADAGTDDSTAIVSGGGARISSSAGSTLSIQTNAGTATEVDLGLGTAFVQTAGSDTVRAGTGTATVNVSANGASVYGGAGSLTVNDNDWTAGHTITVYGASGQINLTNGGPSQMTFIGGSGDAVITGNWGLTSVTGGSGNIIMTGGSGGLMTFVGGSGKATIAPPTSGASIEFGSGTTTVNEPGGGGADVFSFISGHGGGQDVINGFRVTVDQLRFTGVSVVGEKVSGTYATLTLSDHTRVTFNNIVGTMPVLIAKPLLLLLPPGVHTL